MRTVHSRRVSEMEGAGAKICQVCGKKLFKAEVCLRCGGTFCKKHIADHGCRTGAGRHLITIVVAVAFVAVILAVTSYAYLSRFVATGSFFGVTVTRLQRRLSH